ncbi:conserved Plasmodium protein, unknown function [Plasmodium ovale]|uniref:Uncharacterized protein n=1 Tax=Plasmodium ovale TaxID=36330 RepID=A0A1D3U9C3_PLAOA|nr:conserved Plasmodium protein, unknown function [Plasmodium ovale]
MKRTKSKLESNGKKKAKKDDRVGGKRKRSNSIDIHESVERELRHKPNENCKNILVENPSLKKEKVKEKEKEDAREKVKEKEKKKEKEKEDAREKVKEKEKKKEKEKEEAREKVKETEKKKEKEKEEAREKVKETEKKKEKEKEEAREKVKETEKKKEKEKEEAREKVKETEKKKEKEKEEAREKVKETEKKKEKEKEEAREKVKETEKKKEKEKEEAREKVKETEKKKEKEKEEAREKVKETEKKKEKEKEEAREKEKGKERGKEKCKEQELVKEKEKEKAKEKSKEKPKEDAQVNRREINLNGKLGGVDIGSSDVKRRNAERGKVGNGTSRRDKSGNTDSKAKEHSNEGTRREREIEQNKIERIESGGEKGKNPGKNRTVQCVNVNYKEVLSKYVNSHKDLLCNISSKGEMRRKRASKEKAFEEKTSKEKENNRRGTEQAVLKINDLLIKEEKSQENKIIEQISNFYGNIKVKKINNTIGKADYYTLSRKINTDIKVVDHFDMVKLPEPENLDYMLKSPLINSFEDEDNQDKKKKKKKNFFEFYYDIIHYPLEMFEKFIFKNKNHDYNKWVSNCNSLFVLGLPFHLNEQNTLKTLIDLYYSNKNYDGILDIMNLKEENFLCNTLDLYSCFYESPYKYDLLADNLGILYFELLFGTEHCSAKNEMIPSYLYSTFKEFYKRNCCPIGGLGLLHFKNEKYAKEFWISVNNFSSTIYEKYIKLIPDINSCKIFIEASIYYLVPDALFVQINYTELNNALNIIQRKNPDIVRSIDDLKSHYLQTSVWNLIFANVSMHVPTIGNAVGKKGVSNTVGKEIDDAAGKEDNDAIGKEEDDAAGKEADDEARKEADDAAGKEENDGAKDGTVALRGDLPQEDLQNRVNALPYLNTFFPNLLIRIYDTHVNKYLVSNGFCLIACPYLNQETGEKVASFLKKFFLLDWFYNEKDETCYFYIFKTILNVFAVYKRVFNSSQSYSVCALFLKLPFGLVPAVYINVHANVKLTNMNNSFISQNNEKDVSPNRKKNEYDAIVSAYEIYIRSILGTEANVTETIPYVNKNSSTQRKNNSVLKSNENEKIEDNHISSEFLLRNDVYVDYTQRKKEHTTASYDISLFNHNHLNSQAKNGNLNNDMHRTQYSERIHVGTKLTELEKMGGEDIYQGKKRRNDGENTLIIKKILRKVGNNRNEANLKAAGRENNVACT